MQSLSNIRSESLFSNLGDMAYEGAYSDFSAHGFIERWRDEDDLGNTAPARHAYRGVGEDEESKTNPSRTVPSATASLESLSANSAICNIG